MSATREPLRWPVRILAGIVAAPVCLAFGLLGLVVLHGANGGFWIVPALLGALGGCLLDAALFGCRKPWRSCWCLPLLFVFQVGSIRLALDLFPHDPEIHVGSSLVASAAFVALFHRAGYFRVPRDGGPIAS